ncbi:MAG: efflux RND transporter periplasmic adaptor subunit [Pseudomonadota bacterium]
MSVIQYREVNQPEPARQPGRPQWAIEKALELVRRSLDSPTLDSLYYLLTNDLRTLLPFDRCSLIVHLGGRSRPVAVNDQPQLDKRAKFFDDMTSLGAGLKGLNQGLFLPAKAVPADGGDTTLPETVMEALRKYMGSSGSDYVLVVPLTGDAVTVGHLIVEFFPGTAINPEAISNILKLGSLFGAALTKAWIADQKPSTRLLISGEAKRGLRNPRIAKYAAIGAVITALGIFLLFFLPVSATVGGEARIVPKDLYVAYCRVDGLIDKINVKEGEKVDKGTVLATLDPKDLDYKILNAETEFNVLTEQLLLLRNSSDEDPAKLAESRLAELKRKNAWLDLNYAKWQRQFLDIVSPVSGIVTTKQVESLKGKKLKAGEAFCELAVPEDLWVEVYVPEERIAHVTVGQPLRLFLNNDPLETRRLKVAEVAPAAEAHDRLGNTYRVRAPFPGAEGLGKVGMKGIGKIDTEETNLWGIVSQRLVTIWNKASLYF